MNLSSSCFRAVAALSSVLLLGLAASGCRSTGASTGSPPRSSGGAVLRSTNAVPLEVNGEHLLIRGTVNGHPVRLVLDTGASHVSLSPDAAKAAGISQLSPAQFATFGTERASALVGVAKSIKVGQALAEDVPTFVATVPEVFEADGFLGLSFLRRFAFHLDYPNRLLSLAPAGSGALGDDGSRLRMRDDGRLVIEAEVDGAPARLIVDTGAGQSLILRHWFVEAQSLRTRYPRRLSTITGASLLGLMRGEYTRVRAVKLGASTITNVITEFELAIGSRPTDGVAGYIGAGILRRFDLNFDPQGESLWLKPNAQHTVESPPPATLRCGFVCLPDGTIADLIPDSPAAEADVRVGDRLLAVDGQSFELLKFEGLKRALRAPPGTKVRLVVQTAGQARREVTLILRDLL